MSKHIENIKAVKEAIELKLLSDEDGTVIRDLLISTLQSMDRIEKEEAERLEKIRQEAIQKNLRLQREAEDVEREQVREREVQVRKTQIARAKSLKAEYEEHREALQQECNALIPKYESDVERLWEPVTENQKALTDLDIQLETVQRLQIELNELNQSLESIQIEQAKYPSQANLEERLWECKQDQEDAQREYEVLINKIAYGKRVQTFITEIQSTHVKKEDSLSATFQSSQVDEERERIDGLIVLYRALFGDGSFALELGVVEKKTADLVTIHRDLHTHFTIVSELNERWTKVAQQKQAVLTQLDNLPSESAFPHLKSQAQERLRLSEQEYKQQKEERTQKYEADRVLIEQSMAELEATYVVQQSDSISDMVLIPKGEFMMGALEDDEDALDDEKPRHKVTLTRDFMMGQYLVTQALWESVMGSNPSIFRGLNRPVECVSWFDVVEFCNKLSEQEGLEPAYTIKGRDVTCNWAANGYRLPTEAEWEYSARGGEYHKYSGSDNVDDVAWYDGNSGKRTHPVGQKKPNGFGLYDMSGNVYEWVWDKKRGYSHEAVTDPRGRTIVDFSSHYKPYRRVARGGCWYNNSTYVRSSYRSHNRPTPIGFRIVLSL